eukprot:6068245-Pleurochrysis_carterae.AAC.1
MPGFDTTAFVHSAAHLVREQAASSSIVSSILAASPNVRTLTRARARTSASAQARTRTTRGRTHTRTATRSRTHTRAASRTLTLAFAAFNMAESPRLQMKFPRGYMQSFKRFPSEALSSSDFTSS